jgi:hypothetical protein
MWGYVLIGFFGIAVALVVTNWALFDSLLKIEYERFYADWIKDGKPAGMFYRPPGYSLFGAAKRNRVNTRWIFVKPGWIERDEAAERFYKYFRLTGIITYSIGLLLLLAFILIFFMQP